MKASGSNLTPHAADPFCLRSPFVSQVPVGLCRGTQNALHSLIRPSLSCVDKQPGLVCSELCREAFNDSLVEHPVQRVINSRLWDVSVRTALTHVPPWYTWG